MMPNDVRVAFTAFKLHVYITALFWNITFNINMFNGFSCFKDNIYIIIQKRTRANQYVCLLHVHEIVSENHVKIITNILLLIQKDLYFKTKLLDPLYDTSKVKDTNACLCKYMKINVKFTI